jgi:hypothetical protein
MKKLLLILLCLPLIGLGQNKEIIELRNEINLVKENLNSHHKQFKTGLIISIVAVPVTVLGIFTTPALAVVGGIASLIGSITIIDSDKWFGEKLMNRSKEKEAYILEKEQKSQIFAGDKVEVVTTFKTIAGTFISHGKERFSIRTTQGKEKVFTYKNIKSLSKVE